MNIKREGNGISDDLLCCPRLRIEDFLLLLRVMLIYCIHSSTVLRDILHLILQRELLERRRGSHLRSLCIAVDDVPSEMIGVVAQRTRNEARVK